MVIRRLLILLVIVFSWLTVQSQVISSTHVAGQSFSWTVSYNPENEILPIIGSPYLNENWTYGTLISNTNDTLMGLFRFNILEQQIEMIYRTDTLLITNPSLISSIRFEGRNFKYLPVIERINGKEFFKFAYCEQVLSGQIELFRSFDAEIRNNSYASNYMGGGGDGRDYYRHETKLLYKGRDTEVLRELPRNIKKLADSYGVDYHTLKSTIRNNGLDISKENDVIRSVNNTTSTQIRAINVSGSNMSWSTRYVTPTEIAPVVGSVYLNKDWMSGTLTLNTNDSLSGLFRLNVLSQQMEIIYGEDTLLITNPSPVRNIRIADKSFSYLPVIEKINGKEFLRFAYCEQILPGQLQLFRSFEVNIRNNSYVSNYMGGGGDGQDYYYHETKLLFRNRDMGALRELPHNNKKLAVAFGIDYPAFKTVISQNKLDISNENDIIRLILRLDELNNL